MIDREKWSKIENEDSQKHKKKSSEISKDKSRGKEVPAPHKLQYHVYD